MTTGTAGKNHEIERTVAKPVTKPVAELQQPGSNATSEG